tara:strand:+ start:1522 stop:2373 length:852 start_codon:yes stop_codon:yes gene_type:complete
VSIPEWLPDWRDSTQYPDPEVDHTTVFSWEFLRRNAEYQDDWGRLWGGLTESERENPGPVAEPIGLEDKDSAELRHPLEWIGKRWGLRDGSQPHSPALGLDPSTPSEGLMRLSDTKEPTLIFDPTCTMICRGSLASVRKKVIEDAIYITTETGENLQELSEYMLVNPLDTETKRLIEINLQLPIQKQLNRILPFLKIEQQYLKEKGTELVEKRHHVDRIQKYLRVLDAILLGESKEEIAKVLFPHIKNDHSNDYLGNKYVDNYYNAGVRYRDADYLWLALKED